MKSIKLILIAVILVAILGAIVYGLKLGTLQINKNEQSSVREQLYVWGSNTFGQLGTGKIGETMASKAEVNLPDGGKVTAVSAGLNFTVVLDDKGTVWTWGSNKYGQLGDGTSETQRLNPQKVVGLPVIKSLSASQNHVLALSDSGKVWSWGHNLSGELGTGDNDDRSKPVEVTGLPEVSKISAGYRFSLILGKDGTLWGWGGKCQPKDPEALKTFRASITDAETIDGGYLDEDGGDIATINQYNDCVGEDYLNIKTNKPTQFTGVTDIKDISTGFGHILVLRNDGTVWSTGCNKYAQVGNGRVGNTDENKEYHQVKGIDNVKAVSAGFRHSLILKDDGTVWGWGDNKDGQLGLGDRGEIVEPVQMKDVKNVTMISAGHDYSIVVDKDGTVWGTGENEYSVLGKHEEEKDEKEEGSEEEDYVLVPVKLGTFPNIKEVKDGGGHIVIKA